MASTSSAQGQPTRQDLQSKRKATKSTSVVSVAALPRARNRTTQVSLVSISQLQPFFKHPGTHAAIKHVHQTLLSCDRKCYTLLVASSTYFVDRQVLKLHHLSEDVRHDLNRRKADLGPASPTIIHERQGASCCGRELPGRP